MPNCHLAILKKLYLDAILDGRKQVESRFSKVRGGGFGRVAAGDRVFFKVVSGPVCVVASVSAVEHFEGLTPRRMVSLRKRYDRYILGGDEYWDSKSDSKFGFLAWLKDVRPIEPVRISKRDWRGGVVLRRGSDFGLLEGDFTEKAP
ncbi:MAG: hypothetical protein JW720_06560 [Sedimentisphaerales bacterium]|nr:hypothetical protein [Sedimentisphaerales bacterium]